MKASEIITEAKTKTLEAGEALFYTTADGLFIGQDGCQPSNSCCLLAGPLNDDTDEDWSEITEGLKEFINDRS